MWNEEHETWTSIGTDKRRLWHKRTKTMIATFHMDTASGRTLFAMACNLVKGCGGTVLDLDKGEML